MPAAGGLNGYSVLLRVKTTDLRAKINEVLIERQYEASKNLLNAGVLLAWVRKTYYCPKEVAKRPIIVQTQGQIGLLLS